MDAVEEAIEGRLTAAEVEGGLAAPTFDKVEEEEEDRGDFDVKEVDVGTDELENEEEEREVGWNEKGFELNELDTPTI